MKWRIGGGLVVGSVPLCALCDLHACRKPDGARTDGGPMTGLCRTLGLWAQRAAPSPIPHPRGPYLGRCGLMPARLFNEVASRTIIRGRSAPRREGIARKSAAFLSTGQAPFRFRIRRAWRGVGGVATTGTPLAVTWPRLPRGPVGAIPCHASCRSGGPGNVAEPTKSQ